MIKNLTILTLIFLAGYGSVKAWPLIAGPSLSIASPQDNAPFPDGIVVIEGTAKRSARLTLDGAPVLHEENGKFLSTLTFPRGSSILTFVATDRFGRRVTATRSVFVPF